MQGLVHWIRTPRMQMHIFHRMKGRRCDFGRDITAWSVWQTGLRANEDSASFHLGCMKRTNQYMALTWF